MPRDAAALRRAAGQIACDLSADAGAALLRYLDLLARWNKVYNLTALRDPGQMWSHHLLDSLAVVGPLERHAAGAPLKIVDVGSGGGLPAAVLAIVRPDWRVVSVDAVAKKAGFVRQVALELKLANLEACHSRIENLAAAQADVVISRAFASLADFVDLSRSHLNAGGVWVAMKGKRPQDELDAVAGRVDVFHVEPLDVPELDAERHLIWMKPVESAIRSSP